MERSKIKSIIIVLLLLLNLFFILLNLGQSRGEAESQRSIEENVTELLARHDIALDPQIVPWRSALKSYVQSRERYDDRAFAAGLLGEITSEAAGTIVEYRGTNGTVECLPYGAFEVHYEAPYAVAAQSPEEAQAFLKKLGIEAQSDPARCMEETLVFWQTVDGLPVFTCDMQLSYQDGHLVEFAGRRLVGPPETGGETVHTAATLLLFLVQAKEDGIVSCTKLLEIQEGYGQGYAPVWRVRTDEGTIFLDCITGDIRYE